MSRADYLAGRSAKSGPSDLTREVARAHLDLADTLGERRHKLGLELDYAAERAEVTTDRLAQIEEGDTTSLTEIMRLCAALRLRLEIDGRLGVRATLVDDDSERAAEDAMSIARLARRVS